MVCEDSNESSYARGHAEFKAMGLEEAAKEVLREGLLANPSDALLLELAVREGMEVAKEVGARYAISFQEFKDMGCDDAAKEVLREGLRAHPCSPLLMELAVREGALAHLSNRKKNEEPARPVDVFLAMQQSEQDAAALRLMQEGPRYSEQDAAALQEMQDAAALRQMMQSCSSPQMSLLQKQVEQQNLQHQQYGFAASRQSAFLAAPRPTPPPDLPELPLLSFSAQQPHSFLDVEETPESARAATAMKASVLAFACGVAISWAEFCSAYWFVWTLLACHLVGVALLRDYHNERGLLALSAAFVLHAGHASHEVFLWAQDADGADSLGSWSVAVIFVVVLYVHNFCKECVTLPPDYISTLSLFFPVFPAFDAAVVASCLEMFLEWRYFPEYKLWKPAVVVGAVLMALGQAMICFASSKAERNFWASCREVEEEEFVGLEIPDRKVVKDGLYYFERHPGYLGGFLWGVGSQVALCNPVMLCVVSFVLWASMLHVTLEEEKELYSEFPGGYASYSTITRCWIPGFHALLANAAFQREMTANAPTEDEWASDEIPEDEELEEEEEEEDEEEDQDQDPHLWQGVPKGGALWNRQFQDPFRLG